MNSTRCSLSNLLKSIEEVSALMKGAFGPNGKAILFERNGIVTTSKDGGEILSTVQLADPITNVIAQSIIISASEHGDGSKLFALLCRSLLMSSEKLIFNTHENIRRRIMINCLHLISQSVLPKLQECLTSPNNSFLRVTTVNKSMLKNSIYALLITKFSKSVSKVLSEVLSNYLLQCITEIPMKELLEKVVREPSLYMVEVPELPVHLSRVVEGFIITRNFKYLKNVHILKNCSFILWSCPIEYNDIERHDKIEVSDPNKLGNAYFFQIQLFTNTISTLSTKNISLIISSVFFPDWAISVCMRFGVSVIDMVNEEEFRYLSKMLKLEDFSFQYKTEDFDQVGRESFQGFQMGSSKFVRILMQCQQILLCGPTLSQCRQYAKASNKVMTYLFNWIKDTQFYKYSSLKTSVENNEPVKLYFVPCGYYIFLRIYSLLCSTPLDNLTLESKVLTETIKEILYVYYTQNSNYSDGTFMNFLAKSGKSAISCPNNLSQEKTDFNEQMIESPFLVFKIMKEVTETLIQVLKIEHIIKSRLPLKSLKKKMAESDEDE